MNLDICRDGRIGATNAPTLNHDIVNKAKIALLQMMVHFSAKNEVLMEIT